MTTERFPNRVPHHGVARRRSPSDDADHFSLIQRLLDETYGFRSWSSHGAPLDQLIGTVLSQHTSDGNTARAYASLRRAFPTWDAVAAAAPEDVADAIRCGGLGNIKAPRIQRILREVHASTGAFDLASLANLPPDEARSWLESLPGVGPKTAACVLLFSLGMPAMPVDTHVFRVGRRLGLVGSGATPESAPTVFETAAGRDRDAIYSMHLNLIAHGRSVCRARHPRCGACVLASLCPSASIPIVPDSDRMTAGALPT